MLKFFRKIRRRLLVNGHFRKYLAYAIGEILLIILGILIALQINNWNDQRKYNQIESEYLQRIKIDFLRNIEECENQVRFHKLQAENGKMILNSLLEDTLSGDLEPLIFAIKKVSWFSPINITRDTWEELKFTGNISLIRNKDLKASIAGFYSNIDFTLEIENECQSYYLGFKRSVGNLLETSLQVEISEILREDTGERIQLRLPPEEAFFLRLKALEPFDGFLADLIECRQVGEKTFIGHKAQAEMVLNLIDTELN